MQSLYAASKFALEGLSESLHYELVPHGVQVTLVQPGGFRTGFADGMDWPARDLQAFPLYQTHFQGYRNFLRRVARERKGKDPNHVVDAIFKLANRKSVPLRVRVGDDTHALYYLRKCLPQKIVDGVLRKISRTILETQ
jgi:NAD(P)-dependent dehydrogenase (short-subunit alcohol dehydrogenase family)